MGIQDWREMGQVTYGSQVVEGVQLGAQTAVDAEELLVHHCGQG